MADRRYKLIRQEPNEAPVDGNSYVRKDGGWVVASGGGGGGAVDSVFTRTGAVTAQVGDYSAFYSQLGHTHTESDITDLGNYSAVGHTHTEADITDLGTYLTAEVNDLTAAVTWANVPDANITQTSVTQHQAALTITESQISDLGSYLTSVALNDLTDVDLTGATNNDLLYRSGGSWVDTAGGLTYNGTDLAVSGSVTLTADAPFFKGSANAVAGTRRLLEFENWDGVSAYDDVFRVVFATGTGNAASVQFQLANPSFATVIRMEADGTAPGRLVFTEGFTVEASPSLFQGGNASAPGISFTSETNTGFFRSAGNNLDISIAGTHVLNIDTTSVSILENLNVTGSVRKDIDTSNLTVWGGDGTGANIELYGGSHATEANNAFYDAAVHEFRGQGGTPTYLTLSSAALTLGSSIDLVMGTNTVSDNSTNLRLDTSSGYLLFGPQNTTYSHFQTDRARFYFNVGIDVNGNVLPYTTDTYYVGSAANIFERIYGNNFYVGSAAVGYIREVTGSYGSIEVIGAAGSSGTWSGYNIGAEAVFMSNLTGVAATNRWGLYDDLGSRWGIQYNASQADREVVIYCDNEADSSFAAFETQPHDRTGNTSAAAVKDHSNTYRDVGFNVLPVFNSNGSDVMEARHCGTISYKNNTTAYTLTLAASTDLDFPVGGVTTLVNGGSSGDYSVTEGTSTTLYLVDPGTGLTDTAGGCTIGPGGVATVYRLSSTVYYIWGSEITA